jgi:hypothetical protein
MSRRWNYFGIAYFANYALKTGMKAVLPPFRFKGLKKSIIRTKATTIGQEKKVNNYFPPISSLI